MGHGGAGEPPGFPPAGGEAVVQGTRQDAVASSWGGGGGHQLLRLRVTPGKTPTPHRHAPRPRPPGCGGRGRQGPTPTGPPASLCANAAHSTSPTATRVFTCSSPRQPHAFLPVPRDLLPGAELFCLFSGHRRQWARGPSADREEHPLLAQGRGGGRVTRCAVRPGPSVCAWTAWHTHAALPARRVSDALPSSCSVCR